MFGNNCPAERLVSIVPVITILPTCPGAKEPRFHHVVDVLKYVEGNISVITTPLAVFPPAFP